MVQKSNDDAMRSAAREDHTTRSGSQRATTRRVSRNADPTGAPTEVAATCRCQMLLPNAQLLPNVVAKRTNFNGNCEELENACAGRDEVHKKDEPALDAVALLRHVLSVLFNILYSIF